MRRVILESPYKGKVDRNVQYGRKCVRDCLKRGDSPIASHLLFTQEGILFDNLPQERLLGLEAGWEWIRVAEAMVVYNDHGISDGMRAGIGMAKKAGIPIEYRQLD